MTVNDVVVALCAGALRDWLKERDELPREPLVAMVPVSVRTEEQMGTFGNRVSMMIVPIPTNEADPKRAPQAHARAAARRQGAATRRCPRTCSPTPRASSRPPSPRSPRAPRWRSWAARGRRVNVVISNVPGPAQPAVPAQAPSSRRNYPVSVVVDGVGLNITVMSYLDHLDFGIVADRDQVDDVWTLIDRLSGALDEITVAVLGKAAKRQGKRATRPLPKAKAKA